MEKQMRVRLVDTTLRDGEQAPGVSFSHQDKMEIAELLSVSGIDEIEAGIPAMGEDEQKMIRDLLKKNLDCDVSVWCRATRNDLDLAEACGVEHVHISFPASPVHLNVLGWSYARLFKTMETLIPHATSRFRFVSVGIQDAARVPPVMLHKIASMAFTLCVKRLRLADSVGLWMPETVKYAVQEIWQMCPGLQIGVHTHNDLGLATANAVAAVLAGAQSVDTTVTGLGERAGNAALEQVVMALQICAGIPHSIKTEHLNTLCRMVAYKAGRAIADDKPVIGSNVFTHETGIHVHAQIRNRQAYEAFSPALVGRGDDVQVVLGKHSGSSSVHHMLNQMGIRVTQKMAEKILSRVRRLAEKKRRNLYPSELLEIYESVSRKRKYSTVQRSVV
jgi:homocitrate synthase NifV